MSTPPEQRLAPDRPSWWVEPLTEPAHSGCAHCPTKPLTAPMDMVIAVGFGQAGVYCDGVEVWSELWAQHNDKPLWQVSDAESCAEVQQESDWRIVLHGPLNSAEYQRHAPGEWNLIRKGEGFA